VCGGGGWLFNLPAARLIRPLLSTCSHYVSPVHGAAVWSDVFIGLCLKEKLGTQLQWVDLPEFNAHNIEAMLQHTPPSYLNKSQPSGFQRAVSFHYVKPWHIMMAHHRIETAFEGSTTVMALRQLQMDLLLLQQMQQP
jgi:hypothetical protein